MANMKLGKATLKKSKLGSITPDSLTSQSGRRKKSSRSNMNERVRTNGKTNSMGLNDKLDIVALVNIGLKGEVLPLRYKPKTIKFANEIIALSKNAETKSKADLILRKINHSIVKENRNACDLAKSRELYNSLMK